RRFWAATGCGIFVSDDEGQTWRQRLTGLTTPLLSALAVAPNGALFAGGLASDLFSSFNFGEKWQAGLVPEELRGPVTIMLAAPNFAKNGTAFAATDGGGLLVTRNSGKSWEDSSFGLGEDNVLALATTNDWSEREIMFAATIEGVFVSRNGGRAWRETELLMDDDVVDVLAISPDFDQDQTVYAGTESGSLYCSEDGGRTWDQLQARIGDGPVNALWLSPEFGENGRMLAGVGSRVYVSNDRGESWELDTEMPGAVLALAGDSNVVLAGLYDAGVWKSTNGGLTWASSSEGMAARGFAQLVPAGNKLYALGPQEGLWVSENDGQSWHKLNALDEYVPLADFAIQDQVLLVTSQESGILRSTDGGKTWAVADPQPNVQAIAMVANEPFGWAGTSEGKLLSTKDSGATWQAVECPCEGQEILSIAPSTTYNQDHTVLMGTAIASTNEKQARVALWRSTNGGETWRQLTTQTTPARWLDIAVPVGVEEKATEQAVLATGAYCLRPLRRAKDVWISTHVDPAGSNTLSVTALGEVDNGGMILAATGSGIFHSLDGGRTWQPFQEGIEGSSFISITATMQDGKAALYALSLGGILWKRELS
ncbi:MAG: hypothetical protein GX552_05355, partial [Chloroflexi bacterium]|nr:hypothetical protein [Chloroflexota bacterium]